MGMRSSACTNPTYGFVDFRFPHLVLIYLASMAIYADALLRYEQLIF